MNHLFSWVDIVSVPRDYLSLTLHLWTSSDLSEVPSALGSLKTDYSHCIPGAHPSATINPGFRHSQKGAIDTLALTVTEMQVSASSIRMPSSRGLSTMEEVKTQLRRPSNSERQAIASSLFLESMIEEAAAERDSLDGSDGVRPVGCARREGSR